MHIVGGFLDSRKISEDVFMQILRGTCQLSFDIDLVCACVCELNDILVNGKHVPKIYGVGVVISSGEVVPVQQFECQIPDEILRHSALYNQQQEVVQVYSSRTQEITVKPFDVYFPAERARMFASLSDENILKHFSTSSHCEPSNFVDKMRKMFVFLAENQNVLQKFFPRGKPRRFKPGDNREWCLVDDNS